LGLFACFLLLYLWSHISNFFNRDPLYYALQVETSPSWAALLSDRHHLLYRPVARLWFTLWQALGYREGAIFPLQALSALVGAAAVAIFFLLCLRLTQSRRWALLAAAFLGFSYGMWRYSAEAYPHIFLLLFTVSAALALAVGLQENAPAGLPRHRLRAFSVAGILTALAALFYQTGVFFAVAALWLILARRQASRSSRASAALAFLLPCFALALLYLWVITSQERGIGGILHYQYGPSGWMGYGKIMPANLLKAPVGAANLFVGEVFAREHLSALPKVKGILISHSGIPALPHDGAPPSLAALLPLYLLLGASLLALVRLIFLVFFNWRRMGEQFPLGRALAMVWLIPYAAFPIWWFPENRQYWLGALPPLCLLFSLAAKACPHPGSPAKRPGGLRLLALSAGLLALTNLFGSIGPDRRPESNPLLQRTYALADIIGPRDLVITMSAGELKHLSCYLEYYLRCRTVDLLALFFSPKGEAAGRERILQEISLASSEGGRIYLISEAMTSPLIYRQIAKYKSVSPEQVEKVLQGFLSPLNPTLVVSFSGKPLLHRLEPASAPSSIVTPTPRRASSSP